jgi:hypothetical protein
MRFHQLIDFEICYLAVERFPFHQLKGQIQDKRAGESAEESRNVFFLPRS